MADNLGLNGLVVSAGKCAGPIPAENCFAENPFGPKQMTTRKSEHFNPKLSSSRHISTRSIFCAFAQFSAAIGAAHFPAAFGMLLSQHPKEGAPFLGTALAEYKQSIEPAVSCHFLKNNEIR